MATKSFQAACLSRSTIARDIVELRLQKPDDFSFTPGQFVLFDVPLEHDPADIQPRAFSVASAPHEQDLLFVFKLKQGGRASGWVERLSPGDNVSFKGPFGLFTLKEKEGSVAMLCTSTGVAPFRSMLEECAHAGSTQNIDLVFCVRDTDDLFWVEQLQALKERLPGFTLHVTLSRPSPGWTGLQGRLQTAVPAAVGSLAGRGVYVCGNPDMTADLKKLCLETWGVPKELLHVEGYI